MNLTEHTPPQTIIPNAREHVESIKPTNETRVPTDVRGLQQLVEGTVIVSDDAVRGILVPNTNDPRNTISAEGGTFITTDGWEVPLHEDLLLARALDGTARNTTHRSGVMPTEEGINQVGTYAKRLPGTTLKLMEATPKTLFGGTIVPGQPMAVLAPNGEIIQVVVPTSESKSTFVSNDKGTAQQRIKLTPVFNQGDAHEMLVGTGEDEIPTERLRYIAKVEFETGFEYGKNPENKKPGDVVLVFANEQRALNKQSKISQPPYVAQISQKNENSVTLKGATGKAVGFGTSPTLDNENFPGEVSGIGFTELVPGYDASQRPLSVIVSEEKPQAGDFVEVEIGTNSETGRTYVVLGSLENDNPPTIKLASEKGSVNVDATTLQYRRVDLLPAGRS